MGWITEKDYGFWSFSPFQLKYPQLFYGRIHFVMLGFNIHCCCWSTKFVLDISRWIPITQSPLPNRSVSCWLGKDKEDAHFYECSKVTSKMMKILFMNNHQSIFYTLIWDYALLNLLWSSLLYKHQVLLIFLVLLFSVVQNCESCLSECVTLLIHWIYSCNLFGIMWLKMSIKRHEYFTMNVISVKTVLWRTLLSFSSMFFINSFSISKIRNKCHGSPFTKQ